MQPQATYSQVISPEMYNLLISQHLYIEEADQVIAQIVGYHSRGENVQVIEFGCGPGRILGILSDEFICPNVTGVDHDQVFIDYAQKILGWPHVVLADATTYQHQTPIDIAVSQGFHHHVAKGEKTRLYLENVYRQLKPGGIYVVSDEFLPHYNNNHDRLIKAVTWYAHIIGAALRGEHLLLAIEEAKTLLDDLAEGTDENVAKSDVQIQYVLDDVQYLQLDSVQLCYLSEHEMRAKEFLARVSSFRDHLGQGNPSMDLSRGDFKVCHSVFEKEVTAVGFKVIGVKTIGPIETIGGMAVYTLLKE